MLRGRAVDLGVGGSAVELGAVGVEGVGVLRCEAGISFSDLGVVLVAPLSGVAAGVPLTGVVLGIGDGNEGDGLLKRGRLFSGVELDLL
mgnify:CR=1 FL=1